MPRFRLTVAYDGSAYSGWQRQDPPTGEVIRTVQATLEDVVSRVVGEPVVVHGASRTDAGVHAKGQVACFDYRGQVPVERLAAAINSRLPEDVLVTDAAPAPEDFTPSCEAVTKQYSYTWAHGGKNGVLRPLFDRHFVAFSAYALDPEPCMKRRNLWWARTTFWRSPRLIMDEKPRSAPFTAATLCVSTSIACGSWSRDQAFCTTWSASFRALWLKLDEGIER